MKAGQSSRVDLLGAVGSVKSKKSDAHSVRRLSVAGKLWKVKSGDMDHDLLRKIHPTNEKEALLVPRRSFVSVLIFFPRVVPTMILK